MEQSQHQHGQCQKVSRVAKAPQDDQHTVYTTGAGPIVGNGSAAPSPKRLLIRSPDNSPKKPKPKKSRKDSSVANLSAADLDDFYNDWWDVEWEFANLVGDDN